ncbi:GldG family protein [Erythrobacter sp. SDW2]|uniref:GldG family protein n=1 Tax=Erythrobacter sp. SDW2 TaxID=2907154 RepID=UPI001F192530|nr:GldG family protein [Erythrobacter sp. SDW2]UIP06494.1 GldG family protein [Erythrobacter sp. SDW2]
MRIAGAVLAAMLLAACSASTPVSPVESATKENLGLMTSLPILWSGNDAFAALADGEEVQPHWAVATLDRAYRIDPLDALSPEALQRTDVLLLAQPRVLAPAENVALDEWVRAGGRVLLLADPKLVGDYDFPLGDPRRPMDTAMLSPILARWGLELLHDPAAARLRTVSLGEAEMAVADGGSFRLTPADGATCRLMLDALAASCAVGSGHVVLLADATLLEDPVGGEGSPAALRALLGMTRENGPESTRETAGTDR